MTPEERSIAKCRKKGGYRNEALGGVVMAAEDGIYCYRCHAVQGF